MTRIEQAIYAPTLRHIPRKDGYQRVYFGAEFCQWRMPAVVSVIKAYGRALELGMGFTLLTPWVTDAGLSRLDIVFGRLSETAEKSGGAPAEVAVNDFGALMLLREKHRSLVPVLGRLLSGQKRCPRIPGVMEALPQAGRELFLGAGVEDPLTAKFFKKLGVKRVELDNTHQGVGVDLKAAGLKGTLYTPYACVTVTRHCPASFDGTAWQSFTGCRLKGCLGSVLELANPAHEEPLIMRGNAQFTRVPELPDELSRMGIDRVVRMEAVP